MRAGSLVVREQGLLPTPGIQDRWSLGQVWRGPDEEGAQQKWACLPPCCLPGT